MGKKLAGKKRIAVFCFYNSEGVVARYVLRLLSELLTVSNRLIVIANGKISDFGKAAISEYTREIFERENRNYDYGAYRHALENILTKEELQAYDEIIFCNDTFFGFFTELEKILLEMEDADVKGLNIVDRKILGMIQSYFLVLNCKNSKLIDYFRVDRTASDFGEAVAIMETGFLKFLKREGISYSSYTDTKRCCLYQNPLCNIEKYGLPILKVKALSKQYCSDKELMKTMKYISENTSYDLELVTELLDRQLQENDESDEHIRYVADGRVTEEELIAWAQEGPFYILGNGNIAHELFHTYFENNDNFLGYVESKKGINSLSIEEINDGARLMVGVKAESQADITNCITVDADVLKIWEEY